MRVANRAINEAPELQMDKALYVGELYGLPGHGFHHRGREHVSWLEFHHYIGGFSGAGGMLVLGNRKLDPKTDYNGVFADPAAFSKKVHLLWLGVGTNEPERMRGGLQRLHASLLEANIQQVFYESPGTDHEWQTWRPRPEGFCSATILIPSRLKNTEFPLMFWAVIIQQEHRKALTKTDEHDP